MNSKIGLSCAILSSLALASCGSLIIDFKYPQYNYVVKNNAVPVEFAVLGATGVVSSKCSIDGAAEVSCSSGYRFRGVAAGQHSISVSSVDETGRTGRGSVQFRVVPPTLSITSVSPSAVVKANTTPVDFAITDDAGDFVTECQIDANPPYPCPGLHRSAKLTDGLHTLKVTADNGELVLSDRVIFLIDTGSAPARVLARQVEAGGLHTCALTTASKVRCWGYALYGQLGYANTTIIGDDEVPAQLGDVDVGGDVVQISTGADHTCALLGGGKVRCWGRNDSGQLGYGTRSNVGDDERPASLGDVNVGADVVQVSAGGSHTCALLGNRKLRCWGKNTSGQLGYGHTRAIGDDELPSSAPYVDVGGDVLQVDAGGEHTCALLTTGAVRCWGQGNLGQLGSLYAPNIGDDELPSSTSPLVPRDAVQISAGETQSCALSASGDARCWGGVSYVYWPIPLPFADVSAMSSGGTLLQLPPPGPEPSTSSRTTHACALLATGAIRCVGSGGEGQLGVSTTYPSSPVEAALGGPAIGVSAGGVHTCALMSTGMIRCFGYPDARLGYGTARSTLGSIPLTNDVILGLGPTPAIPN